MAHIPVNRLFASMRLGQNVGGNLQMVGDALRMHARIPDLVQSPAPQPISTAVTVRAAESQRLGAFSGAFGGICVGLALGMAAGAAISPIVAILVVIALVIGIGLLLGYIGSLLSPWLAIIGFFGGLYGGACLGQWITVYVMLACPAIAGVFGAYHGSVHGLRLGERVAIRLGAMRTAFLMSALAGLSIATIWLVIYGLTHRVSFLQGLNFLSLTTAAFTFVGGLLSLAALRFAFREPWDDTTATICKRVLSVSGAAILFLYALLPAKGTWMQLSIPQEWLAHNANGSSNPAATATPPAVTKELYRLKADAPIHANRSDDSPPLVVLKAGRSIELVREHNASNLKQVVLMDGRTGYIKGDVLAPVAYQKLWMKLYSSRNASSGSLAPRSWSGEWAGPDTPRTRRRFMIGIRGTAAHIVGEVVWTLQQAPPGGPLSNRIGETSLEYLEGYYNRGNRTLYLHTVGVSDTSMLAPTKYRLWLSKDMKTLEGTGDFGSYWAGRLTPE